MQVSKANNDIPPPSEPWGATLEETWVHIERVIAYWLRILKPAERNYSPTEREALALKEGLIKLQPYIEVETILAVTDHTACCEYTNIFPFFSLLSIVSITFLIYFRSIYLKHTS